MTSPAPQRESQVSRKAGQFTESVIREMTREALKHGAVNLSQGFPDFPAPADIKRVAMEAIADDINQYTVTCGSTEGMIAAMMATVDPGEEVIVFEPFYENYAPDAILSDARPRYVPL